MIQRFMMASNTYVFNGLLREYYRIRKKEVSVVRWYRSYFKACTYFFFSVNACSFTQRDVKSIKKKWIDIQSKTRKREAERRREQKKTGGGPPPLNLKPWEDKIVSILDDSMVVGIEGGFDTSECGSNEFPKATSNATSKFISADASKTQELIPETPPPSFAGDTSMPTGCSTKRKRKITVETACTSDNSKAEQLLNIQREKLELKKSLLEVEKKKLDVLKEICFELKRKNCCCSYSFQTLEPLVELEPASCSVSPTIRGLVVKEI